MLDRAGSLERLGIEHPIVQAPMAGGASTPALAAAVSEAGGLGFLAAGYKSAAAVREEITQTRGLTSRPFGVNVFMPAVDAVDGSAVRAYWKHLLPEAERLGVGPGSPPGDRTDDWDAKIEDLLADPPPVVSFTFGCPDLGTVSEFQVQGTFVIVTVTTQDEALSAATAGADALCVQGVEAGGHQGSFVNDTAGTPLRELLAAVRTITTVPLIAAGGLGTGEYIAEVIELGADAAQLGTAFLRCPESGAHPVHKAALADPRYTRTSPTRAFTGRPARSLVNRFVEEHGEQAPAAYPDVHYLTSPLRRSAAEHGDPDAMSLWAGTSFRLAVDAPAAEIVATLVEGVQRA
ncbi:NAD(P)H-dependent flavin oxidoreductase [Actinomadura sp. SCN-SB]|uniref:NAD(P)H-dependent flavin oxidoreductase n=1 Tax=Actinomadura sp. SCN-SB TaxID=3373092 RepID=UPI003752BC38